ncbi:DUF1043 family protein [Psychromonas sp. MME2]|uniref:YhcB family protein n=1 Tax=Psychromonas sp. MME2 TaxID=3231033 RepID=UPI00339BACB0
MQQQALAQSEAELQRYKSQVNDHFNSSADLMKQVANSYQALYTHMAGQSQSLLSENEKCPFPLLKTAMDVDPLNSEDIIPTDNKEKNNGPSETATNNDDEINVEYESANIDNETLTNDSEIAPVTNEDQDKKNVPEIDNGEVISDANETISPKKVHND